MYSVFDELLDRSTWSTLHEDDLEQFYRLLAKVVDQRDFSPEAMGDYMKRHKNPNFHDAIDRLVANAWAVCDFLRVTGR